MGSTKLGLGVSNVGVPNTGVNAEEFGDKYNHTTVLTVAVENAFNLADNADLANGYLVYTLPAGACIINSVHKSMAVTAADATLADVVAETGIGTTIGVGAIATLSTTMENLNLGSATIPVKKNGAVAVGTTIPTAAVPFVIATGDAHTIYFNTASATTDTTGTDLSVDLSGAITINWTSCV